MTDMDDRDRGDSGGTAAEFDPVIAELEAMYRETGNALYAWEALARTPFDEPLAGWIREYLFGCAVAFATPGQPAWGCPKGTKPMAEFERTPDGRVRVPHDGPWPAQWEKAQHAGLLDLKWDGSDLTADQKAERVARALGLVRPGWNAFERFLRTYRALSVTADYLLDPRRNTDRKRLVHDLGQKLGLGQRRIEQLIEHGRALFAAQRERKKRRG